MDTVLFSKEGKYKAYVKAVPNNEDDGFHYLVIHNGREVIDKQFDSRKRAIRNAQRWLQKKRKKYYKTHPKAWIKRRRKLKNPPEVNPIKTLHKLYKMKKVTAKILVAHSDKQLKLRNEYSKNKGGKKTTAVSGSTSAFSLSIASVMKSGKPKERKLVAKMMQDFVSEPYRKTNMFY